MNRLSSNHLTNYAGHIRNIAKNLLSIHQGQHIPEHCNKAKVFFSESGIKYGLGKVPSKLARLTAFLATMQEVHSVDFSLELSGFSAIEHSAGIVQNGLRTVSTYKKYQAQKKIVSFYSELANYSQQLSSCLIKRTTERNRLVRENRAETLKRLVNNNKNLFHKAISSIYNFFGYNYSYIQPEQHMASGNNDRLQTINQIDQEIASVQEINQKVILALIQMNLLYGAQTQHANKVKDTLKEFYRSIVYVVNYSFKLIKDILKIIMVFMAKGTELTLQLASRIIGNIVYPVSLLLAIYKAYEDVNQMKTMEAAHKKMDFGEDAVCDAIQAHLQSKKHKNVVSLIGNTLSAVGYLFASVSALCYLIPGAVVAASALTPVGWAFAGIGAAVLLGLLAYRLITYCQKRKIKLDCMDVLNDQPGSIEAFKKKYGLAADLDGFQVKRKAMKKLWQVSARYSVVNLVAKIRVAKADTITWSDSTFFQLLARIIPDRTEQDTFHNLDVKAQVSLLCDKLKIKTAAGSTLQYDVFIGLLGSRIK